MERPLNEAMKLCHHKISDFMLVLSLILCLPSLSKLIVSIMRCKKTLPPYTTLAQKLSLPARDCNCFFDARLRFKKRDNSWQTRMSLSSGSRRHMAMESISMPRNVILVEGSTIFFQLIWKPSFLSKAMRMFIAFAHSSKVSALIKKIVKIDDSGFYSMSDEHTSYCLSEPMKYSWCKFTNKTETRVSKSYFQTAILDLSPVCYD